VANIPFTAAVLPIAAFLTRTIPGAESGVLYWTLSAAACFGGNATIIGSASNVVGAGILERAGYRLSFDRYLRVAGPVTLVVLLLSTLWILIRY
jgi:Na+/H+ antiporter NhaD/arsenite permease-like protein